MPKFICAVERDDLSDPECSETYEVYFAQDAAKYYAECQWHRGAFDSNDDIEIYVKTESGEVELYAMELDWEPSFHPTLVEDKKNV